MDVPSREPMRYRLPRARTATRAILSHDRGQDVDVQHLSLPALSVFTTIQNDTDTVILKHGDIKVNR